MVRTVERILESRVFWFIARVILCFPFWASGLSKLINFPAGVGEMAHFGLEPAWLFNLLTIVTQLGGSALIIFNVWPWLGAGALAIFTLLTIPIAHDFWNRSGPERMHEFYVAVEHLGYVGGFMMAAIAARYAALRRPTTAGEAALTPTRGLRV